MLVVAINRVRRCGFCSQLSADLSLDLMMIFADKTENPYIEGTCIKASQVSGSNMCNSNLKDTVADTATDVKSCYKAERKCLGGCWVYY